MNDYPSPIHVKQTALSIIAQHQQLTGKRYPLSVWQTDKLQGAVTAFWSGMLVLANCEVRNAEATNLADPSDHDTTHASVALNLNVQIEQLRKYTAFFGRNGRL